MHSTATNVGKSPVQYGLQFQGHYPTAVTPQQDEALSAFLMSCNDSIAAAVANSGIVSARDSDGGGHASEVHHNQQPML